MSKIVRISDEAKTKITRISESTGRPMTDVLDDAVDALERRMFMDEFNRGYAELRSDPKAWTEIEAERSDWDATLKDGVDGKSS